jgi:hypothetical protein
MKITVCLILADPGSCLEIGYLGGGGGGMQPSFLLFKIIVSPPVFASKSLR